MKPKHPSHTMSLVLATLRVTAVLLLTSGLLSADSWIQLFPVGDTPPPSLQPNGPAVAYDQPGNNLIVSEGDETWTLSNGNGLGGQPVWTKLAPAGALPAKRFQSSVVFSPGSNRLIMFGGYFSGGTQTNEVWVLENANGQGGAPFWTQALPAGALPSARHGHTAVYDTDGDRMIIFGGCATFGAFACSNATLQNDVWVLSHASGVGGTPTWTQLLPSGPLPGVRYSHSATYDPTTNRMTVFGGDNALAIKLGDAWVLESANGVGGTASWSELTPANPIPPHYNHAAGYNPATNEMVIAAGVSNGFAVNDAWKLMDANGIGSPQWIQLSPTGTPPAPRDSLQNSSVMDIVNNRLIFYGGSGNVVFNDVWVLELDLPPASCTLGLDLTYTPGTLTMGFQIGALDPARWSVWFATQSFIFPLWSVPIPSLDPPVPVSIPIPVSQGQGTIGVLTGLSQPGKGIVCSDWQTVNTGGPGPTASQLRENVRSSGLVPEKFLP